MGHHSLSLYRRIAGLSFLFTAAPLTLPAITPKETAFFEKEIRPLLVEHCYKCHSTEEKIKGGLLLDSQEGWMNGGDSGEVIIPGQPDKSLIVEAIRYEDQDFQMPPKYKLSDREIALLTRWVRMGAPDPRNSENAQTIRSQINLEEARNFWAFQPPHAATPPNVAISNWPIDPLDYFILAGLEKAGLKPVQDADRGTLLRRLSFDLTGLPPSPEDLDDFLQDPASDSVALAKAVDRLLDTPQFGERWGRHWLDVVRYAESMGRTRNWPFPFAWRYRDYVIDSFNEDKPYNQFIMEQLAGDLLGGSSDEEKNEHLVATGFLALGAQDLNERNQAKFTMDVVDEQIDVTGRAIMGLTTGCARCHDHKFDPIPTADYYALAGIFKSTDLRSGYSNRKGANQNYFQEDKLISLKGSLPETIPSAENSPAQANRGQQRRQRQLQIQIDELNKQVQQITAQARQEVREARSAGKGRDQGRNNSIGEAARKQVAQIKRQVRKLQQQKKNIGKARKVSATHYAMGVAEGSPTSCKINIRGDAQNLGNRVERGFLQVLAVENPPEINPQTSGRLELAQWMTRQDHPLTSRVMVNRIWHHLFGRGLVGTVDNFGASGERPSHPELLDHLALRFMDQNWSVKSMIRHLVLSRTYRLSTRHAPHNYEVDPDNVLLWRMNMRRLEAEALRDGILAVSGQLDLSRPDGSPVMDMNLGEVGRRGGKPDLIRSRYRSVYLPVLRNYLPDLFEAFDFAEPSSVMGKRDVTTVSTQALFMMNNQFVLEQSKATADRLLKDGSLSGKDRIALAYLGSLGRMPGKEETRRALEFIQDLDQTRELSTNQAWASFCQALFASAEFRYLK